MTSIDHNYKSTNNLLVVPTIGVVNIAILDSASEVVGATTTNSLGEWEEPIVVPLAGVYTVRFEGHFRPPGPISAYSSFLEPTPTLDKTITVVEETSS